MNIGELRRNIDRIDKILLKLLEKRMENSIKIAKYKMSRHQNIVDLKREKEILKKVKNNSNKNFVNENMFLFFVIMYVSKNLQYKKIKEINSKKIQKHFLNKHNCHIITQDELRLLCKANSCELRKIIKHILKNCQACKEEARKKHDIKNQKADFASLGRKRCKRTI